MLKRWPVALAFAAGLAAGLLFYWQSRQQLERLAKDAARERAVAEALREQLSIRDGELAAARTGTPEPHEAPPSAAAPPRAQVTAANDPVTRAALLGLLDEKNQSLSAAQSALGELREKLLTAEARANDLSAQLQRMTAETAQIRERLEASTRLTEALQSEAKLRDNRVVQIEEGNRDLRRKSQEAEQKLNRLAAVSTDMEDLARRRESYISDILRRYREATDQFRAFTLTVDASNDAANPGGTYLSRIQSAVAQADEDLRQLRTLNTRAAQLQKQLGTLSR